MSNIPQMSQACSFISGNISVFSVYVTIADILYIFPLNSATVINCCESILIITAILIFVKYYCIFSKFFIYYYAYFYNQRQISFIIMQIFSHFAFRFRAVSEIFSVTAYKMTAVKIACFTCYSVYVHICCT